MPMVNMKYSKPTKPQHWRQQLRGFTLIEILVALTIIAIALGALIKTSGNHTYSASLLKQKTLAHYVAMNEITRLQVADQWPSTGKKNDSSKLADHEWFWTSDIVAVLDPVTGKPSDKLRQVTLTVYASAERKQNLNKLIAYIAKPVEKQKS